MNESTASSTMACSLMGSPCICLLIWVGLLICCLSQWRRGKSYWRRNLRRKISTLDCCPLHGFVKKDAFFLLEIILKNACDFNMNFVWLNWTIAGVHWKAPFSPILLRINIVLGNKLRTRIKVWLYIRYMPVHNKLANPKYTGRSTRAMAKSFPNCAMIFKAHGSLIYARWRRWWIDASHGGCGSSTNV